MSETKTVNSLVDALKWRYATKAFDPNKKIPAEQWKELQKALQLSPSSYGMQPYKFVVVTDQKKKEELVAHSWNQQQPAECSHLVVFARLDKLTEDHVHHYIKRVADVRGLSEEQLEQYKNMMLGSVKKFSTEEANAWMSKQCYIALGNLMDAASLLNIDNCPMEGFVAAEYDRVLGLKEKGCSAVVLCALGYRSADDKYAKLAKVRLPENELFIHI